MVTRNRVTLARRAVQCFLAQRYDNAELVILDDGEEDYSPMLVELGAGGRVRYVRAPIDGGGRRSLGTLRNDIVGLASADWLVQWDDDEWYHPDRIAVQMAAGQREDAVAVALRWTLVHLAAGRHAGAVFRADTGFATPGTILYRRSAVRYPDLARGEDSTFLHELRSTGKVAVLGRNWSHLFVRCFHGANTWDEHHFERRLHRRPDQWPSWLRAKVTGDVTKHSAFRLDARERSIADQVRASL